LKYCIWNNKGGVGKSFLTYCLATEYAKRHTDEIVVVADMCPQANVSEMLLGGNGKGQENLFSLSNTNRTIAGYIKERYLRSRFEKLGTELQYFVNVDSYNELMPANLVLLAGDFDLDMASRLVSSMANEPIKEAKGRAMTMLKGILDSYEQAHPDKKMTFFIDCNPSFAVYTELAVFASDRIIIPCTGDFSSLRGISKVLKLLYNVSEDIENDSMFELEKFKEKADSLMLPLPKLYLGIINKSRTYAKKATVAYKSHEKQIEAYFGKLNNVPVVTVKDCNNIALVVNYNGTPISSLEAKPYEVYGETSQVNADQVRTMIEDIEKVLQYLVS